MNRIYLIWLLIILFVSSCGNISFDDQEAPTNVPIDSSDTDSDTSKSTHLDVSTFIEAKVETSSQCYESFHEFAYMLPDVDFPESLLPMIPWQIVAIPPEEQIEGELVSDIEVQLVRSTDGMQEIWITKPPIYPKPQTESAFWVYLPKTQEWREVPAQIENSDLFVQNIFLTSDGTIWGKTSWQVAYGEEASPNKGSVLSQFNEHSQRFELSSGVLEIPFTYEQTPLEIVLDEKDIFWIYMQHDGLYRYDPVTETTMKQAELQDLNIIDMALASDGSIYMQDNNGEKLYSRDSFFQLYEGMLSQFIPDTGVFEQVIIPDEPWPNFAGMLVSQTGRLWLGAIGYREIDGTWHLIHPDLDNYFEHAGDYSWAPPRLMIESSDGKLWYKKDLGASLRNEGTAWYDPETGEGCMFTNISANIIEDDQQQLWMFADGKLYRYSLNE